MPQHAILVVDDQADLREIFAAKLVAAGYRVTTAADGRGAMRALAQEKFDLVLTDIVMPDKDGIRLVTELTKHHPEMPVIAMSGGGRMPPHLYLQMAQQLGAVAVLEKPFSDAQLFQSIRLALPDVSFESKP